MATVNRADRIKKIHKVLKKHYTPHAPNPNRSVLEQLLFAGCLENSTPDAAQAVVERLQQDYYDLNEVRVTTVRELAEPLKPLADPESAAIRVKGALQSVFESLYSFDLEGLRKQNIGQAVKTLEKYDAATPFTVAYVTQTALGGHAIPVNEGAMLAMVVVGVLTEAEAAKGRVPGLERTIPKSKGLEFGSLLHQFGVAVFASPYSPEIRKILLEIDPGCKDRLPKRPSKKKAKPAKPEPEKSAKKKSKSAETPAKSAAKSGTKTAGKSSAKSTAKTAAKTPAKKAKKKSASAPPPKKKAAAKKPAAKKPSAKKPAAKKAAPKKASKKPSGTAKKSGSQKSKAQTKTRSKSQSISKRKPK